MMQAATFSCNSCKIKFQLIGISANKSPIIVHTVARSPLNELI